MYWWNQLIYYCDLHHRLFYFSARSFLKDLYVLNPPIEVSKTLSLRCTAYIAISYHSSNFLWFERRFYDTHIHEKTVPVYRRFDCLTPIVSFHNYTVKKNDVGITKITCFLNGQAITKLLANPPGKQVSFFVAFINAFASCYSCCFYFISSFHDRFDGADLDLKAFQLWLSRSCF